MPTQSVETGYLSFSCSGCCVEPGEKIDWKISSVPDVSYRKAQRAILAAPDLLPETGAKIHAELPLETPGGGVN